MGATLLVEGGRSAIRRLLSGSQMHRPLEVTSECAPVPVAGARDCVQMSLDFLPKNHKANFGICEHFLPTVRLQWGDSRHRGFGC